MLIHDVAHRLDDHVRTERCLFEVVGQWSLAEPDPAGARLLAAVSHHHAWRAAQLEPLIPVLHDRDQPTPTEPPVVPPGAEAAAGATTGHVAAVARLLDDRLTAYRADLAAMSPVADAATARMLDVVLADTERDRQAALALLGGAPVSAERPVADRG